ncbi:MAG: DUF2279 domain-containing protein [Ekhidna sp.]
MKIQFQSFLSLTITIWLLMYSSRVSAQKDTTILLNKKRLNLVIGTGLVGYTGSLIGLGTVWYNNLGKFHFFNDIHGWKGADKLGHITTSYTVGRFGTESLRWAGVEERKAIWYGGSLGLVFLTSVEIFDGMSEDWGFSITDAVANAVGSGIFISQELIWSEQRINMKWSYHPTKYAQYRPELLGAGKERALKDYNGQTFWVSTNLSSFLPQSKLPPWLNIAVGYGIDGFTGADSNPTENSNGDLIPSFNRSTKWYLSPDIDLTKIKTNSKFLKFLFGGFNFLKFPAPTLELNENKNIKFHWLFF